MDEGHRILLDIHPQDTGQMHAVGHADDNLARADLRGAREGVAGVGVGGGGEGGVVDDVAVDGVVVDVGLREGQGEHCGDAVDCFGEVGGRGGGGGGEAVYFLEEGRVHERACCEREEEDGEE